MQHIFSDRNRNIKVKYSEWRISIIPSRNRGLANYSAAHEIFASWEGASHYDRYTMLYARNRGGGRG